MIRRTLLVLAGVTVVASGLYVALVGFPPPAWAARCFAGSALAYGAIELWPRAWRFRVRLTEDELATMAERLQADRS